MVAVTGFISTYTDNRGHREIVVTAKRRDAPPYLRCDKCGEKQRKDWCRLKRETIYIDDAIWAEARKQVSCPG